MIGVENGVHGLMVIVEESVAPSAEEMVVSAADEHARTIQYHAGIESLSLSHENV